MLRACERQGQRPVRGVARAPGVTAEGCNTPAYLETQRQKLVSLPCTYADAGL